jgi:hypothetical protein
MSEWNNVRRVKVEDTAHVVSEIEEYVIDSEAGIPDQCRAIFIIGWSDRSITYGWA